MKKTNERSRILEEKIQDIGSKDFFTAPNLNESFKKPSVTGGKNSSIDPKGFFKPASRTSTFARAMGAVKNLVAREEYQGIEIRADRMDLQDIISDQEAFAIAQQEDEQPLEEPSKGWEDKKTGNLPALISRAISHTDGKFYPEWHMVKHLPGYIKSSIRALGRKVFAEWTSTPIEDIWMVSTMVNSEIEVKAMMAWIAKNGIKDDQATMDFSDFFTKSFAGMAPVCETQVWRALDHRFVLVSDFAGYYVYGWPENQTKVSAKNKAALLSFKE